MKKYRVITSTYEGTSFQEVQATGFDLAEFSDTTLLRFWNEGVLVASFRTWSWVQEVLGE